MTSLSDVKQAEIIEAFKLLSVYVFSYFPFGFEGRMWDLIVSVPDHCLSFYLTLSQILRECETFDKTYFS